MLVQDLPKIVNRYHPILNEDSEITVNYPHGVAILSGVRTVVELENRRSAETLSLNIISKKPLRPCQLRAAINKALGDHWQYKQLAIACHNYEF